MRETKKRNFNIRWMIQIEGIPTCEYRKSTPTSTHAKLIVGLNRGWSSMEREAWWFPAWSRLDARRPSWPSWPAPHRQHTTPKPAVWQRTTSWGCTTTLCCRRLSPSSGPSTATSRSSTPISSAQSWRWWSHRTSSVSTANSAGRI